MNKTFHRQVISFFLLLGVLGFGICASIAYWQFNQLSIVNGDLIKSYQTIRAANQTIISIDQAALNNSTFLLTKDPQSLTKIPEDIVAAEVNFATLKQLVEDNAEQKALTTQLTTLFQDKINFLKDVTIKYKAGQIDQALEKVSDSNRLVLTSQIEQLLIAIKQKEVQQLNSVTEKLDHKAFIRKILLCSSLLSALFFLISFVCMDKYLKRY